MATTREGEPRSALTRLGSFAALGRRALDEVEPQALLDETAQRLAAALGADQVAVWELLTDDWSLALRAGVGWRSDLVGSAILPSDQASYVGFAVSAGAVVTVDDLEADDRFLASKFFKEHGIRSGMAVAIPRTRGESAFGVISVHSTRPSAFAREDASHLSAVANVLSPMLEWRRAETERELLQTLTVTISMSSSVEAALAGALSTVLLITGWDCAESWLPTRDGKAMIAGPVRSLSQACGDAFRAANGHHQFQPGEDLVGRVWANRRAEWVVDGFEAATSERWRAAHELGLRTALAVPIVFRNAVLAVVIFYAVERKPKDRRFEELISAAFAPVGPLLEQKRLEEIQRRLAAIVESSDDAIIGQSVEGTILSWNGGARRIYGYSPVEAIGRPISVLTPPERAKELESILERTRRGESLYAHETVRVTKGGRRVDVSLSASPIFDETGRVIGASTIARDITEKKRVEAELKRKEGELSDFVENATEGLHWADAQRRIIWANRAEMNMLGYPPEEYLGRNIEDFFVDPSAARDAFARLLRGEALQNYEARLRCKDGSVKHVLINSDVLWRDGEFIHTRSFTRDITQRKQVEAALSESEERFRTLSDSAPVMMWMTGPDGRATFFNRTWLEFRGHGAQAELGDGWWDGIHFEDRKRFRSTFDTVFAAQNSLETEFRLQRFDGEYRWMLCTGVPRLSGNGNFSGYIGSCIDITERKEAERFLEMHARRQARLIREEARGRRKAEQRARDQLTQLAHLSRFSTMGELATGLAHELNQPLCAIVNFTEACLELIAAGGSTDELRGMMGEVAMQAERAGEVIRHMREFVRKREPRRSAVAVNEIMRDVVSLMKNNVVKQGVDLQLELSEPSLFVWADPIQIQQVVLNLVKNAIEAMQEVDSPEKRVVVGTSERANSRVEVSVADVGPGIPQERLDDIFAPFHSTKESGMGMGLSISQSIIAAHDGEIWVTRNQGRGVTFHFTLPAARSSHDESYESHSLHRG